MIPARPYAPTLAPAPGNPQAGPFTWSQNGAALTADQAIKNRNMAALLMQGGAPATNWADGLSQLVDGFHAGRLNRQADQYTKANPGFGFGIGGLGGSAVAPPQQAPQSMFMASPIGKFASSFARNVFGGD